MVREDWVGQMAAVASMGALEARAEAAVAAEETEVVTAAVVRGVVATVAVMAAVRAAVVEEAARVVVAMAAVMAAVGLDPERLAAEVLAVRAACTA